MKKLGLLFLLFFMTSCAKTLYYGYLPGTDYKYYKPQQTIDLGGGSFDFVFIDARGTSTKINCSEVTLDRQTELEGELGFMYFSGYVMKMVANSNGMIDPNSSNKIVVRLEGLSFRLIGYGFARAHGLVQFSVSSHSFKKTYCSDMTDRDGDAPLKWYSLVTRKTGARVIVSGSVRRAVESFVKDLERPLFAGAYLWSYGANPITAPTPHSPRASCRPESSDVIHSINLKSTPLNVD
jgi:hypothetical protein